MEKIKITVRVKPCKGKKSVEYDGKNVLVKNNTQEDFGFQCDRYLDSNCTQQEVLEKIQLKNSILDAMDGYSVTVFAYGQTAAGKTYTQFGDLEREEEMGLMPRAVEYMVRVKEEKKNEMEFKFRMTCAEVYNDTVYDVLTENRSVVQVRWTKNHGFYCENISVIPVENVKEFKDVILFAADNRKTASHLMNQRSNRSHCLMTIYIDAQPKGNGAAKYGKLLMVDLAGSERVKDTNTKGTGLKEAGHINKSLYALCKVIKALNAGKGNHVPYRDCKLTMLLEASLGGNSKTSMIACISPSPQYAQESIRTSQFAMGVAQIKNRPIAKLNPHEKLIMDLKERIRVLELENSMLRHRESRELSTESSTEHQELPESTTSMENRTLPTRFESTSTLAISTSTLAISTLEPTISTLDSAASSGEHVPVTPSRTPKSSKRKKKKPTKSDKSTKLSTNASLPYIRRKMSKTKILKPKAPTNQMELPNLSPRNELSQQDNSKSKALYDQLCSALDNHLP